MGSYAVLPRYKFDKSELTETLQILKQKQNLQPNNEIITTKYSYWNFDIRAQKHTYCFAYKAIRFFNLVIDIWHLGIS